MTHYTDTQRLQYLLHAEVLDGFAHVTLDRHEYAFHCADEAGREEPNQDDELNGFRRLIDAAIDREFRAQ
jgi:hypothetical protein